MAKPRTTRNRPPSTLAWVAPQLATLTSKAPPGEDWVHEIKYDGYRLLAFLEGSSVRLLTRNQKDWTERFPAVVDALAGLGLEGTVLDGEVAVEVEGGLTSFQALQNALSGVGRGALQFFVFDALHLDGADLRGLPLVERKARLEPALRGAPRPIRFSDHVMGRGAAFFERACRHHLEGIISKRAAAPYRSGRSTDWLKVKCVRQQEFVIGGFTEPGGSRSGLGALHVGAYDGDRLVYHGKVGTGFSSTVLIDLRKRLAPLERRTSPFTNGPRGAAAKSTHWVEPQLVAQVHFTEITNDGSLRHPSFQGLREDKNPREVTLEKPRAVTPESSATDGKSNVKSNVGPAAKSKSTTKSKSKPTAKSASKSTSRSTSKSTSKPTSKPKSPAPSAAPPAPRSAAGSASARRPSRSRSGAGGATDVVGVRLTSPSKVLYPEQGLTKLDLAHYYVAVADRILPHIGGRPLTLVRCPSGHDNWCFFQKHLDESAPPDIERVLVEESDGPEWYGMVTDVKGLVSLAQLGALELHTFSARADRLDRPDRFIIDLDPDEGIEWESVVEAALHVRALLEELELRAFLKTTGGKGLHVVVPLARRSGWAEVRAFSRAVVSLLAQAAPERYTLDVSKRKRRGRILLDYLRNAEGSTAVEVYSTRARAGAPVSAPIEWAELTRGVRANSFTVENLPARLARLKQDPWQDFLAVKQSLTARMKQRVGL